MTQEDKNLLLIDLCARLPYGVKIKTNRGPELMEALSPFSAREIKISGNFDFSYLWFDPYLRPLSSMTEEEKEELLNKLPKYWGLEIDKLGDLYFDICDASYPDIELFTDIIDWLNAHHFDYRGLIEKGLALEAPKDMYKIN